MLPRSPGTYVCWRCLGRKPIPRRSCLPRVLPRTYATYVQNTKEPYDMVGRVSIRDLLRQWEQENKQEKIPVNTPVMHHGSVSNTVQDKSVDEIELKDDNAILGAMEDELAQTRVSALTPGTLVEKTLTGQVTPILSIFITKVGPYHLLCSVRGQISLEVQPYSAFTIKGFLDPILFESLVKALPPNLLDMYKADTLLDLPTPELVAKSEGIVRKLTDFNKEVDAIYRKHAKTLDDLVLNVCHATDHTYRTLPQLTEQTFGSQYLLPDGSYTPAALYAVHQTLITADFGARPLVPPSALYTNQYFYEVPPRSDLDNIDMVDEQVKKYTLFKRNMSMAEDKEKERLEFLRSGGLPLVSFLIKVRKLIDQSREGAALRDTNAAEIPGISGPGLTTDWSEDDLRILRVLEMWAGYEKFSSRSRLHMLGPMIMRATERYKDDFNLSQSVGWTFLKEIGWIPPWEVRARYKALPPSVGAVRGGGFCRPTDNINIEDSLTPDAWEGMRKRWGLPAFAIDSASTEFIDDAISIEPAAAANHWWVHVHVADPGSQIHPESEVAKHAEMLPLTVWMPFHHTSMLPYRWVGDRFSLGEGKACLTFSTLISAKGRVLESEVTPGILDRVIYMTPGEANQVVLRTRNSRMRYSKGQFFVGEYEVEKSPNRHLTSANDLTEEEARMIRHLAMFAKKRKEYGLSEGATPSFPPKPQVDATLTNPNSNNGDRNGEVDLWTVDPYIGLRMSSSNHASFDYSPIVHQAMLVACEGAARWCAGRKVPIPFLSHQVPKKKVRQIVGKLNETIYPVLRAGKTPTMKQWMDMISMIGWQTIGTQPGPFIFHGQEMYAKVTSPLRRYSDLLCHWQIHARMRMEAGIPTPLLYKSNPGVTKDEEAQTPQKPQRSTLPFSGDKLDLEILPMLRVRERLIVQATQNGNKEIALQALIRAWKLGEKVGGVKLPEKFKFVVQQYSRTRKIIKGRLDWFNVEAFFGRNEISNVVEGEDYTVNKHVGNAALRVDDRDHVGEEEEEEQEEEEEEEEDDKEVPDIEVKDPLVNSLNGFESARKSLGASLRFKDLEPGDVLEVTLKDVDVALQHVLVTPLQRIHAVPRENTENKVQHSVNYW